VWLETVEDAVRCATGVEPGKLFKSKDEAPHPSPPPLKGVLN
jgi:hypothetical protein